MQIYEFFCDGKFFEMRGFEQCMSDGPGKGHSGRWCGVGLAYDCIEETAALGDERKLCVIHYFFVSLHFELWKNLGRTIMLNKDETINYYD